MIAVNAADLEDENALPGSTAEMVLKAEGLGFRVQGFGFRVIQM